MIKIYNTLSRSKEQFVPIMQGKVGMYSCGPTVYNFAHIGNLRTYIFMDMLRRVLKYQGYKIKGVMNITDVGHLTDDSDDGEDKMAKTAIAQNKTPYEIAEFYSSVFFKDIEKLNIARPEVVAKATDHIELMISYVEELIQKGFAYEIDDGIYFDISKFEQYGKLSRLNLDEQIAGARVEVNSQKRNPFDFAVWKKAEPNHIMQWQSPWGMGYPGWHIECSAMSRKYLGRLFDIHTGGVDHIPIHHENEIAQNEALSGGQKTVDYWMHGEFMLVNNGKMSKSLGNTYTISQLEERGYCAMDFRYFCLNAHYRKKLNFTFEGLDACKVAYERLLITLFAHKNGQEDVSDLVLDGYEKEFEEAVCDDINIPMALGVLWKMVKEAKCKKVYDLAIKMDRVFGLSLERAHAGETLECDVPQEILDLAQQRKQARQDKDFALSDKLRIAIEEKGFKLEDRPKNEYVVKKQ